MLLKACLNGSRLPGEHPALPVTATELARDVVRVVGAGAGAVHLHVKDAQGRDTLSAAELAAVLVAVRDSAPTLPIGVSTGAWMMPDPDDRVVAIRSWRMLPDFASVNWHEDGADDVAASLLELGVGVEAGLWHGDAVAAWLRSPHRDRCCRVLLELPDGLDEVATETATEGLVRLLAVLRGDSPPVLLHGEGTSCWPALRCAVRRGLALRIGLEDVLELPDGSPAPDNATLVRAARALLPA